MSEEFTDKEFTDKEYIEGLKTIIENLEKKITQLEAENKELKRKKGTKL